MHWKRCNVGVSGCGSGDSGSCVVVVSGKSGNTECNLGVIGVGVIGGGTRVSGSGVTCCDLETSSFIMLPWAVIIRSISPSLVLEIVSCFFMA